MYTSTPQLRWKPKRRVPATRKSTTAFLPCALLPAAACAPPRARVFARRAAGVFCRFCLHLRGGRRKTPGPAFARARLTLRETCLRTLHATAYRRRTFWYLTAGVGRRFKGSSENFCGIYFLPAWLPWRADAAQPGMRHFLRRAREADTAFKQNLLWADTHRFALRGMPERKPSACCAGLLGNMKRRQAPKSQHSFTSKAGDLS